MNVKNVVYRHSRLMRKGIYAARDIVVLKSVHLSEVLKHMDFDRFHIVYVLDDELKIADTIENAYSTLGMEVDAEARVEIGRIVHRLQESEAGIVAVDPLGIAVVKDYEPYKGRTNGLLKSVS